MQSLRKYGPLLALIVIVLIGAIALRGQNPGAAPQPAPTAANNSTKPGTPLAKASPTEAPPDTLDDTPTATAPADETASISAVESRKPTRTPKPSATRTPRTPTSPSTATDDALIMRDVKIYDLSGRLAYQGDVDLRPTFDRIAAGKSDPHPNDGSVYRNRNRQLPRQSDANYYHEYVVRTPGISGPGPQRVILGKHGEAYYTADHYDTFVRVK